MEGRFISRDPIGFAGGDVNLYGYVQNNPTNLKDPSGLKTYKCWRPLYPGKPGDFWPPLLNHTYNCITDANGRTKCDSTNAQPGWSLGDPAAPGVPSDPLKDFYHPDACTTLENDGNYCVETCLEDQWKRPRGLYDIGPGGEDCQEYTDRTFEECARKCGTGKFFR